MITNIEINHYRSIWHADLALHPINLIVGANGSGKSNVVDAIYFLHDCCVNDIETALTRRHGIDSVRQWSKSKPYHIAIELAFQNEDGEGKYKLVLSSYKGDHRVLEETGQWSGIHPYYRYRAHDESDIDTERGTSYFSRNSEGVVKVHTTFTDTEIAETSNISTDDLYLTALSGHFYNETFALFQGISQELTSFSLYSIYPNTLRLPQVISRERSLMESGGNLASVLKSMNSKTFGRNRSDIVAGVRALMPSAEDYRINSAGGFYVPTIRVREPTGDAHEFGLSQISDGTLRALGILTALYQPRAPNKIAMEEPEQMIHPGALVVIAEAIKDFASPKGRPVGGRQIFVTTHSPHLIDLFEPETLIWTRKVDGLTQAGHVSDRQLGLIKDSLFTAGELMLSEGIF
ncbi:MAG: hypothetical protein EOP85_03240 [Verrucomicrobiaceae bacterium]|nr:MAG: hypothetical protein EOP85_03240 [Verrucomicrobiaceae bacterium]